MWKPFIFENLHFAINTFGALSLFSIFWLYLDVWLPKKTLKEGLKVAGFLLLSLSFLLQATRLEASIIVNPLTSGKLVQVILLFTRIAGYILVAAGLAIENIEVHPEVKPKTGAIWSLPVASMAQPLLAGAIGWLYLRKVAVGLEHHLKRVGIGFFVLAVYELLALRGLFVGTSNIAIYKTTAPFGVVWGLEQLVELAAFVIFFSWAFSYLLKRINTQLFIIFTSTVLAIFLLTAVSFSFLLLKNLQDETLSRLDTDASVLSFALEAKKSEAKSIALGLSQNPAVIEAIIGEEKGTLSDLAQKTLVDEKAGSVIVLDGSGKVLARGEERERVGDSLSDDSLVKRVLLGKAETSVITKDGVLAPTVIVRAAAPIVSGEEAIGVALVGIPIDNAFMDGVKKGTGLEAAVFGKDSLSATTITDFTGKTRPIGIKETNKEVLETVLGKGEKKTALVSLLNGQYFASYHPLKDVDGSVVGMIFTGKPAYSVLATAGRSIEITFLVSAVLIIFSIVPTYLISKYIAQQLK
ncbi:hypothetical protein A2129_01795 [Candidatus Woesebacteria bacterium GWC1_42_13]|uniref:Double Cache domain-containing protein n=2 Tax=Candidatus Woeseibacteriota TaxID=1752722 RepID=A0A1F7WZD5_9BACT|nr:MAG: hypothetical protein A2129_01795 [Candidatus Woesebacteria bacterium GWC1_42_13]